MYCSSMFSAVLVSDFFLFWLLPQAQRSTREAAINTIEIFFIVFIISSKYIRI